MATVKKSAKKMQAGGVASKKVKAPMVDPKGAWTKVQERTLGNMKKGGSIKKAQSGKSVKPTSKTVIPTADSSDYFRARMKEDYESAARNMNSPKDSKEAFKRAKKSTDDFFRQGDKGKPGYDKNGFPVKKQRSGGKLSKKK
jgi:hypothetical protein